MITRKVRVQMEFEVEVQIPDKYAEPSFCQEWSEQLWPIEGVDEIAEYAASLAAKGLHGYSHDGIGHLYSGDERLIPGDGVIAKIEYEDVETSIIRSS